MTFIKESYVKYKYIIRFKNELKSKINYLATHSICCDSNLFLALVYIRA